MALEGVARNVATHVPSPLTPVEMGRPVAFVRVPLDGVPSAPPLTTGAPAEPTLTASAVATPVPRPLMPVETGRPERPAGRRSQGRRDKVRGVGENKRACARFVRDNASQFRRGRRRKG